MRRPIQRPPTEPDFLCVGRSDLASTIVSSTAECGSALLFGGRQSGKTTLLKHVARILSETTSIPHNGATQPLGIYIDLRRLASDAGPREFYSYLLATAVEVCARLVPDLPQRLLSADIADTISDVDQFEHAIIELTSATGGRIDGFLFLLDEAKRILGSPFARAFQDNLYSLIYGARVDTFGSILIVFAGAQELQSLLVEDTSPIGTRASMHIIRNLCLDDVRQLARSIIGPEFTISDFIIEAIYETTGGHAGLSSHLSQRLRAALSKGVKLPEIESTLHNETAQLTPLFHQWNRTFTREARCIVDTFLDRDSISLKEVATTLDRAGLERFSADLVWSELQYIGVAIEHESRLSKVNDAYWEYRRRFGSTRNGSSVVMESTGPERKEDVRKSTSVDVHRTVESGETKYVEFKSTLRVDMRTGKKEAHIEYSIAKAVAAFLNSDGGTLIVGVSDDGDILGCENDGFPNEDKMGQHLINIVKLKLGAVATSLVDPSFHDCGGRRILVVDCERSTNPVFVKRKEGKQGFVDEFYVRMGATSSPMAMKDAQDYIRRRF